MAEQEGWRSGWWEKAFERVRNASERRGHPRGNRTMLIVVAYDIRDPKRLKKVADVCKDHGIRVQYSIFECHLEGPQFDQLWESLKEVVDADQDSLVAYPISGDALRKVRTFGTMVCNEQVVAYIY
jgi:CRISPR-associated protein Cas2